jgi:hypothetical protein|tara:strand:+ start:5737 stop:6105 length:369 start_codon:yes stop_codon:yes gene_type:complete
MSEDKLKKEYLKFKKTLGKEEVNMKKVYIISGVVIALVAFLFSGIASSNSDWSGGYRYYYDADEDHKGKMRLFTKRKSSWGSMQIGWDRYVGPTPNFFRTGTVNGHSLNKTGTFFIEQEFKF